MDKIDPDVNASVNIAKKNAQFGFDVNTKSALEKQYETARIGGMELATQTAGADPQLANARARAITNTYAENAVKVAAADATLKQQKQDRVDEMVFTRGALRRDLFKDNLRAYNEDQAASSDLLGAGIKNYFGNQWHRNDVAQMKATNAASEPDYSLLWNMAMADTKNQKGSTSTKPEITD